MFLQVLRSTAEYDVDLRVSSTCPSRSRWTSERRLSACCWSGQYHETAAGVAMPARQKPKERGAPSATFLEPSKSGQACRAGIEKQISVLEDDTRRCEHLSRARCLRRKRPKLYDQTKNKANKTKFSDCGLSDRSLCEARRVNEISHF